MNKSYDDTGNLNESELKMSNKQRLLASKSGEDSENDN